MKPRLTIETIPLCSRGCAIARAFVDQLRLYSMADDNSGVILGFDPLRQGRDHLYSIECRAKLCIAFSETGCPGACVNELRQNFGRSQC